MTTRLRSTHTFALMELSPDAFDEIRQQLVDAGYAHAILFDDDRVTLDMHGIGLVRLAEDRPLVPVQVFDDTNTVRETASGPVTPLDPP